MGDRGRQKRQNKPCRVGAPIHVHTHTIYIGDSVLPPYLPCDALRARKTRDDTTSVCCIYIYTHTHAAHTTIKRRADGGETNLLVKKARVLAVLVDVRVCVLYEGERVFVAGARYDNVAVEARSVTEHRLALLLFQGLVEEMPESSSKQSSHADKSVGKQAVRCKRRIEGRDVGLYTRWDVFLAHVVRKMGAVKGRRLWRCTA